jgi:RHH-type proline utilization regulon transcriptional repressor/proline dehydrogenase/delta 1-pyrroline-5-carboxylate dehydrogenase
MAEVARERERTIARLALDHRPEQLERAILRPVVDEDDLGAIPRVNVSVKLSALDPQIDVKAWEKSKESVKGRIRPIFRLAIAQGAAITLDMESYDLKDFTLAAFYDLLSEPRDP